LASGIPVSEWAGEDERTIATAFELLKPKPQRSDDEPTMSG
jgi:hypothetical protein